MFTLVFHQKCKHFFPFYSSHHDNNRNNYYYCCAANTFCALQRKGEIASDFCLNTANKKITFKVCEGDLAYHSSTSVMHERLKRIHTGHLNETESSLAT